MNREMECILVTELLPLYLEEQTGKESRKQIEDHIKICEKCKKELSYMKRSYGEASGYGKKKNIKQVWEKMRNKVLFGYGLLLLLTWIYIVICFI